MGNCNFSLTFILLLAFVINKSLCLYEDQIGKFDWRQKYVGRVIYSHIDLKAKLKRIFVATESNTVAAIFLKSGTIIWRQVLEIGEEGKIISFGFTGSEVITITGNGPSYLVRGWNPNSGILLFEWILPTDFSNSKFGMDSSRLYQVKFTDTDIAVTTWILQNGDVVNTNSISFVLKNFKSLLCNSHILHASISRTDNKTSFLDLNWLELNKFENVGGSAENIGPLTWRSWSLPLMSFEDWDKSFWKLECLPNTDVGSIRVDLPDMSTLILVHSNDVKKPFLSTFFEPSKTKNFYGIAKVQNDVVLQQLEPSEKGYSLSGVGLESNKKLKDLSGYLEIRENNVQANAFSCAVVATKLSCYLLLTGDDHSVMLSSAGRILWTREEALASIVTVEMLDLPISDVEAAIEKEFASKEGGLLGMFLRRLVSQVGQFELALEWALGRNLQGNRSGARADLVKDTFGLHKLIIAVTSPSKIFGIDNNNGEIVWQRRVEEVEPYIILGKPKVPLYIQRTTRVHPLSAQWTLLFKEKESKNSVLFVFNPINGQSLGSGRIPLGFRVLQGTLLPTADEEFIRGLLLFGPTPESPLTVFPESSKGIAFASIESLFLYLLDPDEGVMSGYTLAYSQPNEGLLATEVWRLKVGGGGVESSVVAVAGKSPQERVHSQGRVLGDRSVLYKYLNPSLVAIATQMKDPVHKSILSLHLVDTVSGRIIFSVMHKRASEPFHVVHSENWVVYTYFNDKFRRTEIVTLEVYEGKTQANTTAFSSLIQNITPFVERQAYIFPHHIMAMKETITEKGITSKHVLVGLGSGGVMEVPWILLDPRRSSLVGSGGGNEGMMREEGLIPYIPELALPSEAIVSYNQTLANIAGIHTSPAGLESTCLVFVYGLDLFYTRVAPSKTFDVLKDDFEYWLITAVLCGLTIAAYATKRLASRKALRQAWK